MTGTQPDEGYTVLCCRGPGCGTQSQRVAVEDSLRAAVRHSRHGVLALGGCVLGTLLCRTCGPNSRPEHGTFVLVQPCTAQREPTGPTVPIGPLNTADHLIALSRWLREGHLTSGSLPKQLYPRLAPLYAAYRN